MSRDRTRALLLLVVVMAALAALGWWLDGGGHLSPGVFALGGLAGCVLLVVVSKALGKVWLQRPDDEP
jgi:predicted Co/Zn/Cd cation transporter (cation efflux family)